MMENKNLFNSYVNKSEGPGPGHYEKKTKRIPRQERSELKKYFLWWSDG